MELNISSYKNINL